MRLNQSSGPYFNGRRLEPYLVALDQMKQFLFTTDIAAPAERVWSVMSDVERWHEWTPSITRIKRFGGGPFTKGSWALVRQPKLPPAFWKVTTIEPGKSFAWTSLGPGFRAVGTHRVEPTPAGSRATLLLELHGPLGGIFGRMMRRLNERYLAFEAGGLKARSENPQFRRFGSRVSA